MAQPKTIEVNRTTRETTIRLLLDLSENGPQIAELGLPFFEHMLHAMAFHGGFRLEIRGSGDIAVDAHHLVEDVGLVLGEAFHRVLAELGPVRRYGHSVIPMDDALSEAVIDVCERPFLAYSATFPQDFSGTFQMALLREFFLAFSNRAQINLHLNCRYGYNSHHMAESLFKAFGRALAAAYAPGTGASPGAMSTKGVL
ncbi:MAG TPA: imidazoleglycerol-phosphate dehydratase [Spirochaetia bacterium]|nr:imidazoleglycerol-phosphate dehydratase [Spirochaetia bacterium]